MKNAKKVLSPVLAGILLLTMLFTGVTLLSTTAEEEYEPARSITVSTETNINPTFFLETGSSLFKDGETYTLTGKMKAEITGDIEGNENHFVQIDGPEAKGFVDQRFTKSTDGWVDITMGDGKPYTFQNDYGWIHFGMWFVKGSVSVADIVIKDSKGEVVYDMTKDADFWTDGTYPNHMEAKSIWYVWNYGGSNDYTFTVKTAYEPTRSITVSTEKNVNPTFFLETGSSLFKDGETYTLTGKMKAEITGNIEGNENHFVQIDGPEAKGFVDQRFTKSTDGWVDITMGDGKPYTFQNDYGWIHFGMWFVKGSVSVADIVIKDSKGEVVYDMTKDADFWTDGTYPNHMEAKSIWYVWNYGGSNDYTFTVKTAYEPTRSITVSTEKNVNPTFFLETGSSLFKDGETYTLTGKMKAEITGNIEGNENHFVQIDGPEAKGFVDQRFTKSTDGWVDITMGDGKPYTFQNDYGWIHFGMWFVKGSVSVADVVIKDSKGEVVYDMTKDADFWTDGTYTNPMEQKGIWYVYNYGANYGGGDYTFTVKTNADVPTPPDPGPEPEPEFPTVEDIRIAHDNTVNRVVGIRCTENINPTFTMSLLYDAEMLDGKTGPYTVTAKLKLSDYAAMQDGGNAFVDFVVGNQTANQARYTANTDGWVDAEWTLDTKGLDAKMIFGMYYASGEFLVADLVIRDANGELVYYMANDPTLYGTTDMKQYASDPWSAADYGSDKSSLIFSTTKMEEYVPNRVFTVTPDTSVNKPAINPVIIINTESDKFESGKTYTLTGKVKINLTGEITGTSNTMNAGYGGRYQGTTNGWISIVDKTGKPYTFKGKTGYFTFLMWYATGNLSVADLTITDEDGVVVYSMEGDQEFPSTKNRYSAMWGDPYILVTYGDQNACWFSSYTAETVTDHSAENYRMPTFELPSDENPDPTPDPDPDPTPDPTPDPDPDKDPETGDRASALIPAIVLLAGAAVTLTAVRRRKAR